MKNFLLEEFNSVQIWILGCNLDLKKMSSWKIIQKILLFNKVTYEQAIFATHSKWDHPIEAAGSSLIDLNI